MFRCIGISQFDGFVHITYYNQLTVGKRLFRNILAGQQSQLTLHFFFHRLLQCPGSGNQYRLAVYTMFCLAQQVGSHKRRIGSFIRQHFHFRRTGRHINSYITQAHQLFGSRYILITRTEYLIYFRHAFRTIGHCRNGLHTAGFENTVYSRHLSRKQNGRVYFSILTRRSTKHYLLTSCNLCRNSQHQHGRKKRSRSAGDVQPDFLYGNRLLPTSNSRLSFHPFTFEALCRMKGLNILFGQTNGFFQFLAHQCFRFRLLFFRHSQCGQRHFIKFFFVFQYGAVAFRFHTVYNTPYRIEEIFRVHHRTFQQFRPLRFIRISY